jgi:hypothetical protein
MSVEARKPDDGEEGKEAHDKNNRRSRRLFKRVEKRATLNPRVVHKMNKCRDEVDHGGRHEICDKQAEVAVVPYSHTVAHPRAVMVKLFHAVVAHATVRHTRRAVDATRAAVLEQVCLSFDTNFSVRHMPASVVRR